MTDFKESFYQNKVDEFYRENGKCCAGCDHWRFHNSFVGDCTKSQIMKPEDRLKMIGISGCTGVIGTGHAVTPREYVCALFEDTFDWDSLND